MKTAHGQGNEGIDTEKLTFYSVWAKFYLIKYFFLQVLHQYVNLIWLYKDYIHSFETESVEMIQKMRSNVVIYWIIKNIHLFVKINTI